MNLGSLRVSIGVDSAPLTRGLSSAKGQVEAFTRSVGSSSQGLSAVERALGQTAAGSARLSQGLAGVGSSAKTAALGLGGLSIAGGIATAFGAAVKASIEFNKQMANVAAVSGGSAAHINELKSAVQDLAQETGTDTTDLSKGLYQIVSAFGDTADSAKQLAINTKLAIGGVSTVEHAIALTSAVTKAYGDASAEAQKKVADLSLQTVKLGQTRLPELAAAIGKVTPLAAQLKVSQQELFGVMATGTGVTGTAAEVSTQFRGVLQSLLAPTEQMTALFRKAGVASGQALIEQRGFAGALQLIVDTANASHTPLQKYIQSVEAQTLAYSLAGPQAQQLIDKIKAMGSASGELERALDKQTKGVNTLGTEWEKLKQTLTVVAQNFGELVTPALTKATAAGNAYLQWLQKLGKEKGAEDAGTAGRVSARLMARFGPEPRFQGLVDEARSKYLQGLSPAGGQFVGGPITPSGTTRTGPPAPTKEQLDAHNKVLAALEGQAFDTARQKAVQYYGELSKQVASLDLYHKAWEKLTGGEQKNALQLLENEKAEERSKNAVKAGQDAVEKRAKAVEEADKKRTAAHERYKDALKDVQAETRDLKDYTGMNAIRREHPGESPKAQKALYDAQQYAQFLKDSQASSQAAEEEDKRVNEAMKSKLKSSQLDADSALAKRKYGEVNRESLALESEWNKHYLELAPNQQKVIDGLYQLALAKQLNERMDKEFVEDAKRRVKEHEDSARAADKEREALLDLEKVMNERRRAVDREKQDQFDAGLKKLGDELNAPNEERLQALQTLRDQMQNIFVGAFEQLDQGFAGFFEGVLRGFNQMLVQMAHDYLSSQLVNLIMGKPNAQNSTSGGGGGGLINLIGSAVGGFFGGGGSTGGGGGIVGPVLGPAIPAGMASVQAAQRPALAGAGGGGGNVHITMNVSTPDVGGFRANQKALISDAARQAQTLSRRNG